MTPTEALATLRRRVLEALARHGSTGLTRAALQRRFGSYLYSQALTSADLARVLEDFLEAGAASVSTDLRKAAGREGKAGGYRAVRWWIVTPIVH